MNEQLKQIEAYIDSHREEMIDFWRKLVNFQAGSKEFERMEQLIRLVEQRFTREGFECRLVPSGKAPVLVAVDGPERDGKPIIFCGHLDTVFPSGSYPDDPFEIQDGIAYGPGVMDMKGGVAMTLYIIKALRHIGYDRHPIKVILVGDEETIHAGSTAADIIYEESIGGLCAINMENGRGDDCLSVGRKGCLDVHITVNGKAAHIGNEFLAGANAIEEMAHKILAIQALTRYEEGILVGVDVIRGGTVSNAIPDFCKIEVDFRYSRMADLEMLKQQVLDICSKTYVPGTKTTVEFVGVIPVFEKTEGNMALLDMANRMAEAYGLPTFGSVVPGGGSDTSYIARAGIPALDSCGVKGSGAHTMSECAIVETMFERSKIFAATVAQMD